MPLFISFANAAARMLRATLSLSFIDNFNRTTTSLDNGLSSDGKALWKIFLGAFSTNGSTATSGSTSAVVAAQLGGTTITNAQVDIPNGDGGVGLAFWTTGANSVWAAYNYYTPTSITELTSCDTTTVYYGHTSCDGCDSYCVTRTRYECYCCNEYIGNNYTLSNCTTACSSLGGVCDTIGYTDVGVHEGGYVTTTYYDSQFIIESYNGSTWTTRSSSTYNRNTTASYTRAYSIAISTSNNTISWSVYANANKSGLLGNSSYTPSSPVKGNYYGMIKRPSNALQGSTLDNISVTVS